MFFRLLALIFMTMYADFARASEEFVTRDGDYAHFGDRKTLRREGDIVRVWVSSIPVYKSPATGPVTAANTIDKTLYSFNCSKQMFATLQQVQYENKTGNPIASTWSNPNPQRPRYSFVVPGSIAAALLDWSCESLKR